MVAHFLEWFSRIFVIAQNEHCFPSKEEPIYTIWGQLKQDFAPPGREQVFSCVVFSCGFQIRHMPIHFKLGL
jgi:hypothetical protein